MSHRFSSVRPYPDGHRRTEQQDRVHDFVEAQPGRTTAEIASATGVQLETVNTILRYTFTYEKAGRRGREVLWRLRDED